MTQHTPSNAVPHSDHSDSETAHESQRSTAHFRRRYNPGQQNRLRRPKLQSTQEAHASDTMELPNGGRVEHRKRAGWILGSPFWWWAVDGKSDAALTPGDTAANDVDTARGESEHNPLTQAHASHQNANLTITEYTKRRLKPTRSVKARRIRE